MVWNEARENADWLHITSASYLGKNRWYDDRFHPDNISRILFLRVFLALEILWFFDNGGTAGYETPSANTPHGINVITRFYSRVVEFNPVTLEKVCEYSRPCNTSLQFFSYNVSDAQRLPSGNIFITEGAVGRIF